MEHKLIEKENWERQLDITVSRDEIKPQLDKAYNDARPYITHKGFRKGQVPINFIKKLYGKQIEGDALGDIANEVFNKVLKEQKFNFVGEPKLTNIDDQNDTVTFSFSFEVMPEFELSDYQDIEIDEPVHNVIDEEIEKELEELTINNGTLAPAEQIIDDLHVANVTIQEIDEASGLPVNAEKKEETDIFLHSPYVAPDLRESLLNLKEGDNFNYKPAESDPSAPQATYNIKINKVMKLVPVELSDAFIKEYTQGKFSTPDEYREEIGFKLQEKWNQKSREAMEEQIVNKLVDMNEFDVPKGLLMKVVEGMTEDLKKQYKDIPNLNNITAADMFNDLEPSATSRLKWEIIRAQIIDKEKLEVEDHDLDPLVEEEAGRRNSDPGKIKEELKSNQNVIGQILYKKVIDLLLDYAVTNEVEFDEQGHYHPEGEEHHHHEHNDEEHEDSNDDENTKDENTKEKEETDLDN